MSSYSSSQTAYDSIGIGKRYIKREISSALKKFIKITSGENLYNTHLIDYLKVCRSIDDLGSFLVSKQRELGISWTSRLPRFAQTNEGYLVIWWDVYDNESGWQTYNTTIINKCLDAGITALSFKRIYPRMSYDDGNELDGEKFNSEGYTKIYRGVLCGFIINIPKDFKPQRREV